MTGWNDTSSNRPMAAYVGLNENDTCWNRLMTVYDWMKMPCVRTESWQLMTQWKWHVLESINDSLWLNENDTCPNRLMVLHWLKSHVSIDTEGWEDFRLIYHSSLHFMIQDLTGFKSYHRRRRSHETKRLRFPRRTMTNKQTKNP